MGEAEDGSGGDSALLILVLDNTEDSTVELYTSLWKEFAPALISYMFATESSVNFWVFLNVKIPQQVCKWHAVDTTEEREVI